MYTVLLVIDIYLMPSQNNSRKKENRWEGGNLLHVEKQKCRQRGGDPLLAVSSAEQQTARRVFPPRPVQKIRYRRREGYLLAMPKGRDTDGEEGVPSSPC